MKTLKKTLCLVLAVVMVVGVLVLPANAATTTAADTEATAAFNTLNKYGVMYGVDANNTPALSKNINRQDMAAIIYRVMTGDTADKYVANYAPSANDFADSATFDAWAKGYIGYAGSKGIFKGDNNGNFKPKEEIKGDDVLTVLLRCIGYGQNGEFTGANYAANAKAQAADINLFGGAKDYVNVPEDMSKVINRGAVAKLTYNAIQAPMAVYYNGTYSVYQDNQGRPSAPGIGTKNPSLVVYDGGKSAMKFDIWGAPYYEYAPTIKFNSSYNAAEKKLDKYTEQVAPIGEYWAATTECDIAYDGKLTGNTTLETYTNGAGNKGTQYVQPTDTIGTVGAQGQWIRTFDTIDDDNKTVIDRIVYVDTLLAQVTKVVKEEKDANGHIKTSASLQLHVYNESSPVTSVSDAKNYEIPGNDYNKGDFILLAAVAKADGTLADSVTGNTANYKVFGLAPSFTGKQTTIWYNKASHVIDDKTYPDNNRYTLDVAQHDGSTYVWFTDTKGNVIGSIKPESAPSSYAVLTGIIWVNGDPGHAEVSLLYMDGTTATAPLAKIDLGKNGTAFAEDNSEKDWTNKESTAAAADGLTNTVSVATKTAYVSDEGGNNAMFKGYALYEVVTGSNGAVTLKQTKFLKDDDCKVDNKGTVITSTTYDSSSIGTKRVYVDDNTVFIVRVEDTNGRVTYDRYVGKDEVPSFDDSKTLTLFYADIKGNNDRVAEYVYVNKGTEADEDPIHLVAALSSTYSNGLYSGFSNVYTLDSAFVGDEAVGAGVIIATTDTQIKELAKNYNQLYWVGYTSGKVTTATAITKAGVRVDTGAAAATAADSVYKLDKVKYTSGMLMAEYGATPSVNSWNTNNSSVKVYGKTKDDLKDIDWSKVNAYAVLAATSEDLKALYIFDKPAGADNSTAPSTGTTYTVTLATSNSLRIKLPATVTAKTDGKTAVTFTITGPMATATEALSATVTGGTATVAIDWTSAGATVGDYTYKVTVSDVTGNVTVTLNIVDPTATISAVPAGTTVVLPESSGAVTLPTNTGEGTIDANGNDINVTEATAISGTVKNAGKVSSEAAITVSGTLEAETIAEGAQVTVEAGGKLDADKIEAGAKITATAGTKDEPGAIMDVQSTNPTDVQEVVNLTTSGNAKVTGVIGAVAKVSEETTATYEGESIKVKAGYVFSFKTGDSKGSANITVQITNEAGDVVIDGGTVPPKYAAMDVVFYQFQDFTSGKHKPSSNDVLTITVKDGTTVIAAAKFTYTETE